MAWTTLRSRLDAYERLLRLDRPIGTLLLLWPTLWALWIAAEGAPDVRVLWIFLVGTLLMRSAGCAINDVADRGFDPHVERTRSRPLAAGEIAAWEAVLLAAVLAFLAFLLILPLPPLTLALSFPAVLIAASYPFTKRFFSLPQAYLGLAFSFGIPMAYAATRDEVPAEAWWLLGINAFWVMAYDTEYAMVDREDDLKLGLRTSAITFGRFDVLAVALCYAAFAAGMAALGIERGMGAAFWAGLAIAAVLMARHVAMIRGRGREACFRAFLDNHWVGFAVFAGVALDYALRLRAWPRWVG